MLILLIGTNRIKVKDSNRIVAAIEEYKLILVFTIYCDL